MVLSVRTMNADNDNRDPFTPLAALTANVVRYLSLNEKQDEQGRGEQDAGRPEEKEREGESRDVLYRLREIERFERRADGRDAPRRKRNI